MMLFIQEAAQTAKILPNGAAGLTTAGWIFVSVAWTTIISVLIFCYRKVLQKSVEQKQGALRESPPLGEEVNQDKVIK